MVFSWSKLLLMRISLDVMVVEWIVKNANFSTLRGTKIFPMAVSYMK
jgi:hypothetical protein